jgi:L-seryl-tRNA(Ser) seleniumtransferase
MMKAARGGNAERVGDWAMPDNKQELFRRLPSVEKLLQHPEVATLASRWNRSMVGDAVSAEIETLRSGISSGKISANEIAALVDDLPRNIAARVEVLTAPAFRRVINATGIVVHTNLGRSPVPDSALERIAELGGRYLNLEYDLESGERGKRDSALRRLLALLFPGFDGLAVNNNAAAVLLALNTLADGREVIISRGQIIEIGESFRISEILSKSGARLVEVGTTNRTRIEDYIKAINPQTALLLTAHPSNYRVVGFTAEVPFAELVALGRERGLPVIQDWGSGCLVPPLEFNVSGEESAAELLQRGPDAICFSGDKLLGGPQAGIIVGKPEIIRRMRSNHLYRALRLDKLILIALEETLRAYLSGNEKTLPTLEMLSRPIADLKARAEKICKKVGDRARVVDSQAMVGGGAAPQTAIPSVALEIDPGQIGADELKRRLRRFDPPIIARVADDKVLLDLRTVFPDEDDLLSQALQK